jgi:hypothetical protein
MVAPFVDFIRRVPVGASQWGRLGCPVYVKLTNSENREQVETEMAALVEANLGEGLRAAGGRLDFALQPFEDTHLYSDFEDDRLATGDIRYVYLFAIIAGMVLIMAAVNFVNLATARASRRALEVGMRKSFGSPRSWLVAQFLGESMTIALLGLAVAVFLVDLFLPTFNQLAGRNIALDLTGDPRLIFYAVGFAVLTGGLAGIYPAIYLSAFEPLRALRLRSGGRASKSILRRVLVVFQFTVSIALVLATLTVGKQINFMKSERLGFDKEHILAIRGLDDMPEGTDAVLRDELASLQGVVATSLSSGVPGGFFSRMSIGSEGAEGEDQFMVVMAADEAFPTVLGLEIVQGRAFSPEIISDRSESALINETAVACMGWQDPIGRTIRREETTADGERTVEYTVIGVLRDFHHQSLHSRIEPAVLLGSFFGENARARFLVARLGPGDPTATMARIEAKWTEVTNDLPLDFYFVDDAFDGLYQSEERLGRIALWLSVLAVFVGCLGLLGISAYTVEQRTKEIGIRKVLGATAAGIIVAITREVVLLVAAANLIAWPVGYYFMSDWLTEFAYRTDLGVDVFLFAGLITMGIAMLTIGWQAFRAARANPVKALRYE